MIDSVALLSQAKDAYAVSQQARVTAGAQAPDAGKVRETAKQFEAFFVSQMLDQMWAGVGVDEEFGGGHAEEIWRSMLNQEYGKEISKRGGLGIGDAVMKEMLKAQEDRTRDQRQPVVSAQSDSNGASDVAGAAMAATAAYSVQR